MQCLTSIEIVRFLLLLNFVPSVDFLVPLNLKLSIAAAVAWDGTIGWVRVGKSDAAL
jgi:hypothetical protein